MGMIKEFKEFALGGSLVDMAVGIVMGGAIGTLVGSLVTNLINPVVGLFLGGTDLGSLATKIGERTVPKLDESGAEIGTMTEDLMLNYGKFIDSFIQFLILAFVIFVIVKMVNSAKKRMNAEAAAAGPTDNELLTEIRDALRK